MSNFLHEDLKKSLIVELEISIKNNTWATEPCLSRSYADTHTSADQMAYVYALITGKEATSMCENPPHSLDREARKHAHKTNKQTNLAKT